MSPETDGSASLFKALKFTAKIYKNASKLFGSRGSHHAERRKDLKGFIGDIEAMTEKNTDFRRVLYTGNNLQLVVMAIQPGDEIGQETHDDRDQFFRIEAGVGEIWIDGVCNKVKADDGVVVPQGARHNVVCTGAEPLRLYTIYGPPEHVDGTVHKTCGDASTAQEHFDGKTTE